MNNSVNSIDHSICTGCMMCSDICAKSAISFKNDLGFWYPSVDEDKCVNCGICSKRCPALKDAPTAYGPISCYGAKSKDENTRWLSTSGGFFTELANAIIHDNGVCVGAEYGSNCEVIHSIEKNLEGVNRLRQSKYSQSYTEGIYANTKRILDTGVLVLFCGTPCQVEALKSYLRKSYDNLLTMDFFCLGICSPVVYRKYLDWLEKKYNSKVRRVWFKNKKAGWRSIGTRIEFENGKVYFREGKRDPFMVAFVGDSIAMRQSCETCKFRKIPHNSDITVADFWGVEKINPQIDDNKGISAVIVNSAKGQLWFDIVKDNLDYFETTIDLITQGNFSAIRPKKSGINREEFLKSLSTYSITYALNKFGTQFTYNKRVKMELSHLKKTIKSWINNTLA